MLSFDRNLVTPRWPPDLPAFMRAVMAMVRMVETGGTGT
jgi:hypothetical protein